MARLALASLLALLVTRGACINSSAQRPAADATVSGDATSDADTGTPVGEPCDGPGDTRCSVGQDAVEVCSDGTWHATVCGANRFCVDVGGAQCLEASGTVECRQLIYCYLGCGAQPESLQGACQLDCYLSGTVQAQSQLVAFQTCADRSACSAGDAGSDTLTCLDDACRTPLAQCYFPDSGQASCASILTCYEGCQKDPSCEAACGQDATLDAQGRFAILELCLWFACADHPDDASCLDTALGLQGACQPFVRKCLNPLN
ncbi:MAG: hypothetical protein U1F43_28395 [Myxococcota bacterium]